MKATCGTIRVDVPNSTEASDSAWSENNEIIGMSRGWNGFQVGCLLGGRCFDSWHGTINQLLLLPHFFTTALFKC